MVTSAVTKISPMLCVFLLYWTMPSLRAEKHSLYYIYTVLSKPVDLPGIYQFTAMGLLDDIQIDYYNSVEQRKIPKQTWMKEKMQEDYWEKGTQSRKSKEQWFNVNVDILISRMNQSESDVHVLQWRHGCEIERQGDEVKFSKGIDEYAYDGADFLSFDDKESQWVAPVAEALPTKRKWDSVPILNQYTKGYLEKECVDWLNKFREYANEELRNASPPEVHMLPKKGITRRGKSGTVVQRSPASSTEESLYIFCTGVPENVVKPVFVRGTIRDRSKLKLTCMATGFYPKDITLNIRKYRTSLPEDDVESTGIRPNHDGTFQLRKSVKINEHEEAYDCIVLHRTLKEPIIITWGN
ncbi:MHC class I antigen [Labeo rohita]|uniref:MHC class I antigen n=1 Tax=Labeo rohita TaxID=84645 RepID=A0A498N0F4_LABRO|nr:MHC class I antigen [Labeo rohita]